MRAISILLATLVVSGCVSGGVGIAAGQISRKSNENQVSVNKNSYMTTMDTYEIALEHCSKFGKRPELVRAAGFWDLWLQDKYSCVSN